MQNEERKTSTAEPPNPERRAVVVQSSIVNLFVSLELLCGKKCSAKPR